MGMATATAERRTTIEEVRRFWDRRPCNVRHSPREPGTRTYFDEVEARKYFVEPHIPSFAEFPRWRGKRVLEVGCGIGTDTINFSRAGARVTAVDLSGRSLEIARRRAEVFGLADRIRFVQGDAESLSRHVPPEPYDLVYSFGVIHHTPRPDRAVAEIRKYVRPGGTVKLMLYHRYATKVLGILLREGHGAVWRLDELAARHSEAQTGCPVTSLWTPGRVRTLLTGFRIRSMRVDHIFPYRVEDYVQYRYRRVWQYRWLPRPVFRALERLFGWHLLVDAEA